MGVKYLKKFTDKKIGMKDVDLRQETELAMRRGIGKPIFVFDASSLESFLSLKYVNENIFGGRHWVCSMLLGSIFKKLVEYGAELVFFFDGSVLDGKMTYWKEREDDKYESQMKVMKMVEDGKATVESIMRERWTTGHDFKANHDLLPVVRASCAKFGRVFVCEDNASDREIACFLQKNPSAIGVFSNDTDHLIFPGPWKFFSVYDIINRQGELKCKEYPRSELRLKWGVNDLQLAVVAILCVKYSQTSTNEIFRIDPRTLDFQTIVEIVKKAIPRSTIFANDAKKIFGLFMKNLDKSYKDSIDVDNFKTIFEHLINFYLCNENLTTTYDDYIWAFYNSLSFRVMNNKSIPMCPHFFDLEESSTFGDFQDLFVSRLQRQVGAIIRISSIDSRQFAMLARVDHESGCQTVYVEPEFPPFKFSESFLNDNECDDERLMLLKWLSHINETDHFVNLGVFPDNYIVDILTMSFLFTNKMITVREMDILLWTIFACNQRNIVPINLTIDKYRVINYRTFRIAHLYGRIYNDILNSVDICGLRKRFWKPMRFDGVFFHLEYARYMSRGTDKDRLTPVLSRTTGQQKLRQFTDLQEKMHRQFVNA